MNLILMLCLLLLIIAHYYNQFVLLSVYSYEFFVSELIVWLCFFF